MIESGVLGFWNGETAQYASPKNPSPKNMWESVSGHTKTAEAHLASARALETGKKGDHERAAYLHMDAATLHTKHGNQDLSANHSLHAGRHQKAAHEMGSE